MHPTKYTYFLRTLLVIASALIVTVAISTYFTTRSLSSYVSEEIADIYRSQKEQIEPLLDAVLQSVDTSLLAISLNKNFNKQIREITQDNIVRIDERIQMVGYMKTLSQSVSIDAFAFLCLTDTGFAITQVGTGTYDTFLSYRNFHFQYQQKKNDRNLLDRIQQTRSAHYISITENNDVMRVLPIYHAGDIIAMIGVEFNLEALLKTKKLDIITDETFYIYQGDECIARFHSSEENEKTLQKCIQQPDKTYEINGRSFHVLESDSETNKGLRYINLIEINLSQYRTNVERFILIANIAVVGISLLFAFTAAKAIYLPIRKIADMLPGEHRKGDALMSIHQSTQFMLYSIDHLNGYISKLEPMANASILWEILEGTILHSKDMSLHQFDQSGECAVLIIRFHERQPNQAEKQKEILRYVSGYLNEIRDCFAVCKEDCVCSVLLCKDVMGRINELRVNELRFLLDTVMKESQHKLYCVFGSCEVSPGEAKMNNQALRISYVHAVEMLSVYYRMSEPEDILLYSDMYISGTASGQILGKAEIAQLYESFRLGQYPKIKEVLDQLIITAKQQSDVVQIKRFFGELLNIILCSQKENSVDEALYHQLECYENMDDAYDMILSMAEKVCDRNRKIEESANLSDFEEKVDEFIRENYTSTIGLAEVADHFGYSTRYFGQLYSKQIDEPFSKKLNKYRIEQAIRQMQETDQDFAVVAEHVGFNNYKSFSRAFSEQTGMTPSQYKAFLQQGG